MSKLKFHIASIFFLCSVISLASSQPESLKHERLIFADQNPVYISVGSAWYHDFPNVTAAIHSIPFNNSNRYIITLQPGVYREKVLIPRHTDFVTIRGQSKLLYDTKIVFNDTHASAGGTGRSATFTVMGKYFIAEHITFQNDAPFANPGAKDAQAVALKLSGDFAKVSNCLLTSSQDTLQDDQGRHLFENTVIKGNIDFIFGSARSLYEGCKIISNSNATSDGTVTAHGKSNTTANTSGFSFHNCYVGGTGKVLLGRAWGSDAFVVFIDSYLDDAVDPVGWVHWNDVYNETSSTAFYGEYNNFGPGANRHQHVNWTRPIKDWEAAFYGSKDFVYGAEWL